MKKKTLICTLTLIAFGNAIIWGLIAYIFCKSLLMTTTTIGICFFFTLSVLFFFAGTKQR